MPPNESFKARDRIRQDVHFRKIFARKRRASDERMVIYVADNGLTWSRLGVRANRQVGPAVLRNRIRRRLRDIFRRRRSLFPRGLDVICVIKPGQEYHYAALATSFVRLVAKAATKSSHGRQSDKPR